jgi:hypothetical protein
MRSFDACLNELAVPDFIEEIADAVLDRAGLVVADCPETRRMSRSSPGILMGW